MGVEIPFYINYLNQVLSDRIDSNPKYSLRSFARSLEVDPSHLSKILSRKIIPSLKMAEAIIKKLELENEKKKKFIESLAEELKCSSIDKLDSSLSNCDD